MAATDQELKKLNKTVDEAVNILKIYVGNSSQIKNMHEKQREAINKWFDVTEYAEETEKQKRKFTERERDEHGRFIKKREDQANKFMGIADSVKGMFKGMTKGVVIGIGSMATGIKTHFMNFFQTLKSHFLGLFGEESEWFDLLGSIKDSIMGITGSFARGFMMIFRRTPAWASKQISILKDMYRLQIKQMKMDFLDAKGDKKKGGIWGIIATILLSIGAAIGAWLHRYLVLLTKLPIFEKIARMFTKIDDIPFIGRLFKAVKFGFKWLGWPLTILLSLIDFIKGYKESEGDMWDKIKGGLISAIEGFVELPVRFVGWVTEKLLNFLGIEAVNVGDQMMATFRKVFDFLLDFNPFAPIIDFIEGFANTEGGIGDKLKGGASNIMENMSERIDKWFGPLMDSISPIIMGVSNFFIEFWNAAVEWIKSKIPDWMPGRDKIVSGLEGMTASKMETPTEISSPAETVSKTETKKIENDVQNAKKMEEAVGAMKEMQKNSKNDATRNTLNAMSNTNQRTETGDVKQIPDEIDNNLVSVKNYSGELD